ncbi:MAG: PQQ-like beta-propeller repeat protein [Thermoplasmata archaeon]|nr:PQQ-like beta-propeller repeat protein [Thermoplasmata archaeon]
MRIYVTLLVVITMLSVSFAETIEKDENTSSHPWPMFCHDVQHTGRSEYDTSTNEGKIKWKINTGVIMGSPVIANDGTIYVGGLGPIKNGTLYAINPNGTIKWIKNIPPKTKYGFSHIRTSPAIGEDGTIYVGTWEGYLYAFTPDGEEKWKISLGNWINDLSLDENGTIYAGIFSISYPNPSPAKFFAVFPNGTIKWNFTTEATVAWSPAIGKDGILYGGATDSYLYAVYVSNGNLKWRYKTKATRVSSPSIGEDGIIYFGTDQWWGNNRLYALYPNGTLKWDFKPDNEVYGATSYPPAIAEDGTLYFGTGEGRIYAVDKDGNKKWHKHVGQYPTPPVIGADGTIYIAATKKVSPTYPREDGYLYAFNPNGTIKWRIMLHSDIPYDYCYPSPMAIGRDGTIYIGTWFGSEKGDWGYLYAIGTREEKGEIIINGNDDFTKENGVIEGNGSRENPFLIRGWNFSKLIIKNTDAYFIIEYCDFCDKGLTIKKCKKRRDKEMRYFFMLKWRLSHKLQ